VARTDESVRGRLKILFANFFSGQVPGLIAATDGTGENGVPDDGHVPSVFGPGADDVGRAVFGVARCGAVGEAQTAEVKEIVGAVALVHGRVLRTGTQPDFAELLANLAESRDVVFVGVGEEDVAQLKLVVGKELQNRLRVPSRCRRGRLRAKTSSQSGSN